VISPPRHRTVSDVMTKRVHVARPMTPFKLLVQLIEDNRISAVPIIDEQGVPVGIVSEGDLLFKERRHELATAPSLLHPKRRREQRAKAEGGVASEIMTAPPITVRCDATLPEAARLVQESNVRRLIVVDDRGKIAGIVSRSDLLQVFLRSEEELRDEIVSSLIPAILTDLRELVDVAVRWNVVTLSGEVDRKSDVEILTRMIREMDGVVEVVDRLTYRWDDSVAAPRQPVSPEPRFRVL
jgi:CBS domain-containing protein